jgi:hypothetical protein
MSDHTKGYKAPPTITYIVLPYLYSIVPHFGQKMFHLKTEMTLSLKIKQPKTSGMTGINWLMMEGKEG